MWYFRKKYSRNYFWNLLLWYHLFLKNINLQGKKVWVGKPLSSWLGSDCRLVKISCMFVTRKSTNCCLKQWLTNTLQVSTVSTKKEETRKNYFRSKQCNTILLQAKIGMLLLFCLTCGSLFLFKEGLCYVVFILNCCKFSAKCLLIAFSNFWWIMLWLWSRLWTS